MTSPHFTPDEAALILIDHQINTVQLATNLSPDTAVRNAALLGQAALAYEMPIVMTSCQEDRAPGAAAPHPARRDARGLRDKGLALRRR